MVRVQKNQCLVLQVLYQQNRKKRCQVLNTNIITLRKIPQTYGSTNGQNKLPTNVLIGIFLPLIFSIDLSQCGGSLPILFYDNHKNLYFQFHLPLATKWAPFRDPLVLQKAPCVTYSLNIKQLWKSTRGNWLNQV